MMKCLKCGQEMFAVEGWEEQPGFWECRNQLCNFHEEDANDIHREDNNMDVAHGHSA
jgi:hypothetical protein